MIDVQPSKRLIQKCLVADFILSFPVSKMSSSVVNFTLSYLASNNFILYFRDSEWTQSKNNYIMQHHREREEGPIGFIIGTTFKVLLLKWTSLFTEPPADSIRKRKTHPGFNGLVNTVNTSLRCEDGSVESHRPFVLLWALFRSAFLMQFHHQIQEMIALLITLHLSKHHTQTFVRS